MDKSRAHNKPKARKKSGPRGQLGDSAYARGDQDPISRKSQYIHDLQMARAVELEKKARDVKEKTIVSLQETVKTLQTNIEERSSWLKDNPVYSVTAPKFSSKYSMRSESVARNADNRMAAALERIDDSITLSTLTKEQRAVIACIKKKFAEDVLTQTQQTVSEFHAYIEDNPAYVGLSESDMKLAHEDLNNCVQNVELRLTREMSKQIREITLPAKVSRVQRRYRNLRGHEEKEESARVAEYRRNGMVKYRELREQLEKEAADEMETFELEAEELRQNKVSETQIQSCRQEITASVDKRNREKLSKLARTMTREIRMLSAEEGESEVSESPTLCGKVSSMMSAYLEQYKNTHTRAGVVVTTQYIQEDVLGAVDLGFEESCGDWQGFVAVMCYYFPMTDLPQKDAARFARLYAVSAVTFDDTKIEIQDELDVQITQLQQQRDRLMTDVRFLDSRIKQRLKKPAVVKTERNVSAAVKLSKDTAAYLAYTKSLSLVSESATESLSTAGDTATKSSTTVESNTSTTPPYLDELFHAEIDELKQAINTPLKKRMNNRDAYALRRARDEM